MMMRMMHRLIYRLLLVKLIFAVVVFVQGYWYWLLNFELAFFSSILIVFGSFHAYKGLIQRRLEAGEGSDEAVLEKIDDPYELYDEDEGDIKSNTGDISKIVKEEKLRLKQNRQTLKKTIKSSAGLFSPWRFIPYIILILSFIGLNNNHILDIPAFLLGIGLGVLSAVLIGLKSFNR